MTEKKTAQRAGQLEAIKHTRSRARMPKHAVFADKTKYNRKKQKRKDYLEKIDC